MLRNVTHEKRFQMVYYHLLEHYLERKEGEKKRKIEMLRNVTHEKRFQMVYYHLLEHHLERKEGKKNCAT